MSTPTDMSSPPIKTETSTPSSLSTPTSTSTPPTKPPRLINPLTSLPIIHPAEAELLFHAAAIRYARIPHEGLRRICADAGVAMRACDPTFGFQELLQVWMEKLEVEKKIWEEEKRVNREKDRREGAWGSARVVCHVREAQHFFQAADIYYKGLKKQEYRSIAKVCMDAFQALQRVRDEGPEVLRETMTEWLEKLEVERDMVEGERENIEGEE
ncbi:hypothetical protein HBI56_059780 [Parastagonospora nodorum]|uniref:Uncharacterized protein n=1 Tax=Phaeosphaeria nodorum (strain SN15 / ATCC MYA-4574 / FGSC 10173) TaxID=321614 RepID=A0A7U2F487_PHANO|nr:hypothetical protein HBH56_158830 [Parastagonospora nodorum]QRC97353.1 hypothetical protein JI435_088650 [Parastagonospora nodorum SN15]KAH3922513.1 hypothetical protein HBH54_223260 [Parastagonospora nodorum]KAH3947066.1 hypothetical protein HBH53_123080 [Parastagonospora nodorum]KAH3969508.1 hypothetical protein HBH52_171090 [Parastagonospora nodorum]